MTRLRRFAVASGITLAVLVLGFGILAATDLRVATALRYWRAPDGYLVPVAGVRHADLRSTWGAARSGGRKHRGVDIFAPKGTPVVSVVDGVVWSVGTNSLGGRVVWVVGEGRAAYYYAHLDTWAPDLRAGDRVRAGDLLGTVGNTGNAKTTPAHLHFAVHRVGLRGALGVDPVPVLHGARTVRATEVTRAGPRPGHVRHAHRGRG